MLSGQGINHHQASAFTWRADGSFDETNHRLNLCASIEVLRKIRVKSIVVSFFCYVTLFDRLQEDQKSRFPKSCGDRGSIFGFNSSRRLLTVWPPPQAPPCCKPQSAMQKFLPVTPCSSIQSFNCFSHSHLRQPAQINSSTDSQNFFF